MPNKTFFTYEQQFEKLTKEKQLVISDAEFAKETLQKLSYFSLIGGYKDLFKHKPSGKYLHGVTFEEITAFYYFDEELRTLFLKYILHGRCDSLTIFILLCYFFKYMLLCI